MKNIFAIITTLLISAQVFAAGSITLQGVLRGFSHNSIEISDGPKTYSIAKNKLTKAQEAQVSKLKTGDKVTLQIPFEAIVSAKSFSR